MGRHPSVWGKFMQAYMIAYMDGVVNIYTEAIVLSLHTFSTYCRLWILNSPPPFMYWLSEMSDWLNISLKHPSKNVHVSLSMNVIMGSCVMLQVALLNGL